MNGAKYIGLKYTPGNDLRRGSGFCLQVGQAHPSEAGRKYIGSAVHRVAVVLHVVVALAARLLDVFPLHSYRRCGLILSFECKAALF